MNELVTSKASKVPPAQDFTSAAKQIVAAAALHNVTVLQNQLTVVGNQSVTITHAPISGIDRYKAADFAAGRAIQLLLIESKRPLSLSNGSYVVTAKFGPRARSGKVTFTDRNGKVALTRDLLIRTKAQAAVLFPDVYDNPPVSLPVITSTHVWIVDANGNGHWGVDCSGWDPYRTIYYFVD